MLLVAPILVENENYYHESAKLTGRNAMSGGAMGSGASTVESCDVTNCTYNRSNQCHAGAIKVSFVDGMAHCATYTPAGGAVGMGASEAMGSGVAQGTSDDMQGGARS
jgi:hypothetical protein